MFHALRHSVAKRMRWLFMMGILLPGMFNTLDAQHEVSDSLKNLQKEYSRNARISEAQGYIYKAIDEYEAYFEAGGDKDKMAYKLANLYYLSRDYERAYSYYDSITTEPSRKYALAFYRQGEVSLNLGKYQEAVDYLDTFRKLYRGKRDPNDYRRQARSLVEKAEWAMVHEDSVADVEVQNVGRPVNQPHIEFSPFPLDDDEFLYGSLITDSVNNPGNIRQLYLAKRTGNSWVAEGKFTGTANDPAQHTGNAALSADGSRMYFTRCRKNWRDERICEIYLSEKEHGVWQEPVKLPYPVNDENYTTTQPALGVYQRTGADILYFVSDRPGSRGGLDIWYTYYDKRREEYREPRTLGSRINTRGDECCPFYDNSSGALYFSSKNLPGPGGYDIYKSTGAMRRWTDPMPLPAPINSSYDDQYFTTLPDAEEGYFTSNRPGSFAMENGSCCDDIFYYRFNQCTRVPLSGTVVNVTNYDIYDELNERYNLDLEYPTDSLPAPDVPVQLFLIDESSGEELMVSQKQTDGSGRFDFFLEKNREFKLVVKNYGFFDKVTRVNTHNSKCSEVINAGITKVNILPELTVRFNVYYEHDKSRLTRDARNTIDTLILPVFDLFPNAIIEIGSHTDSTGTDSYNDKLSQRRSESVVRYLAEQGISEDRLVARGYGESQPIAPNTNPDGTDNPEGRQLNRRTELRIVGELNSFYIDE